MAQPYIYYGEALGPDLCENARDHIGAFIKLCYRDEYDAMRYSFVAIGFLLFMLHLANFCALVESHGARKLNANRRIQNHWQSSLTCVMGSFSFILGSINPWGIEMGPARHFGYIFGTIAVVASTQVLMAQLYFWYTISLALAASVTLKPVGEMNGVSRLKWLLIILMAILWIVYLTFSVLLCVHFGLEDEESRTIVTSVQNARFYLYFSLTCIQLTVTVVVGIRIYLCFKELNDHVDRMTEEMRTARSDHFTKARAAGQRIVWYCALLTILQAGILIVVGVTAFKPFENDVILTWDMIWPRLAMIWTAVALFYVWFLIMFRYDRDLDERNKWQVRVYMAVFGGQGAIGAANGEAPEEPTGQSLTAATEVPSHAGDSDIAGDSNVIPSTSQSQAGQSAGQNI